MSGIARLDDRERLAARLGVSAAEGDLLALALERFGLSALDFVIGDLAIALAETDGSVVLARSFLSAQPLFWRADRQGLDWASLPQALRRSKDHPPDLSRLARFAGGVSFEDGLSHFPGVQTLAHGTAMRWSPGGDRRQVWQWRPNRTNGPRHVAEAGEELRALLDQAVADRLFNVQSPVASHLSAGRDSSAVTASLAAIRKQGIIALTGAPSLDFAGPHRDGGLSDESEIAALAANRMAGVEHRVVRPAGPVDLDEMSRLNGFLHRPLPNLSALPWTAATFGEAARAGAGVLLVGSRGNFTISLGTHFFIANLIAERGPLAGAKAVLRMASGDPKRLRSGLHGAVGPFLPSALYRALLERSGKGVSAAMTLPFLREPWRSEAEAALALEFGDPRPTRDAFAETADMLVRNDPAELMTEAAYGVQPRDPCADRRLVEFAFSLDPELLLPTRAQERPVYAAAFSRRLPDAVVNGRARGYQVADWFLQFPRQKVERRWHDLFEHDLVSELFDVAAIRDALDCWPTTRLQSPDVLLRYRNQLLGALAVADWLAVHFPD